MQKWKARLEGVAWTVLVLFAGAAVAATVTSLADSATKGTLSRVRGGTGTTMSATAAAAAASAVNTAGGLAALDGTGQIPASILANSPSGASGVSVVGTINAQSAVANGAVIVDDTIYMQTATATHPGLMLAADKTKVDETLSITCTTPAANDTYIFNGTNLSCVHHPVAQSSASATVTLTDTWYNTTTPNILTAASAVTVSFPTAASVPAAVGTMVFLEQRGGDVTASGISAAVTLNAEGGKLTTNGLYAIIGCIYNGSDVWSCFGNRK